MSFGIVIVTIYCVLPKEISFDALDCLVRSVLCEVLCARSCAHVLCARLVRIPKCLRASNVLCAVLCGCCARLVRSVRRRLWVWDIFSGGLVRSCAGVLGGTIPHKTPHNTLYLDKVLCASCAPGAFAKKVLCAPCAEFLVGVFQYNKHNVLFHLDLCLYPCASAWFPHAS